MSPLHLQNLLSLRCGLVFGYWELHIMFSWGFLSGLKVLVSGLTFWPPSSRLNLPGALSLTKGGALLEISKPSMKTFVAVPIFILASGIQHDCHEHLASLKKYTLPQHYWFQSVVCPHYTSECLIYLAIAIVAAPPGQLLNKTVLAGLGFVASNLAVT